METLDILYTIALVYCLTTIVWLTLTLSVDKDIEPMAYLIIVIPFYNTVLLLVQLPLVLRWLNKETAL